MRNALSAEAFSAIKQRTRFKSTTSGDAIPQRTSAAEALEHRRSRSSVQGSQSDENVEDIDSVPAFAATELKVEMKTLVEEALRDVHSKLDRIAMDLKKANTPKPPDDSATGRLPEPPVIEPPPSSLRPWLKTQLPPSPSSNHLPLPQGSVRPKRRSHNVVENAEGHSDCGDSVASSCNQQGTARPKRRSRNLLERNEGHSDCGDSVAESCNKQARSGELHTRSGELHTQKLGPRTMSSERESNLGGMKKLIQKSAVVNWNRMFSPDYSSHGNGRIDEPRHSSIHSDSIMSEMFRAVNRIRPRSKLVKDIWVFLEDPDMVFGGITFMRFMSLATVISAVIPVMQTIQPTPMAHSQALIIESVLDITFAVEVIVRFISCPNRCAFCLSLYNLVDLAACLLGLFLRSISSSSLLDANTRGSSTFLILLICTVPIIRLLKLLRRFEASYLIIRAFRAASEALPALFFILSLLVLSFSSIVFIVEPRDNIPSLPVAMWLTVVTVGTVGYGDITPSSAAGNIVISILILTSALYMAIPIGIVGREFTTVWDNRHRLLVIQKARTRLLAQGYRAEDIPALFFSYDKDSDGEISIGEFLRLMDDLQVGLSGDKAKELFEFVDETRSGTIDDGEFTKTVFPDMYWRIYGDISQDIKEIDVEEPSPELRRNSVLPGLAGLKETDEEGSSPQNLERPMMSSPSSAGFEEDFLSESEADEFPSSLCVAIPISENSGQTK